MDHLPVELQCSILKFLLPDSRHPCYDRQGLDAAEWTKRHRPFISFFPFNVAFVCTLWRDILARLPECWTYVIFDLAKNPAPLIDVFLWSKDLENIEVVVFTSSECTQNEDPQKAIEYRRAFTISEALKPHIHRCKSIVFDVIYSSSLPPSTIFFRQEAPCLEELALSCRIDDIIVENGSWTTEEDKRRPPMATSFPKLSMISLTGFWFMYLTLTPDGSEWFNQLILTGYTSLSISQFRFHESGHYSLPKFLYYLSRLGTEQSFHFDCLSLSYPYSGIQDVYRDLELSGSFYFKFVSNDFLVHLYAICDISSSAFLSFEACRIPKITQLQYGCQLVLKNIIDDDKSHSLHNILEVWAGTELTINSCPSFNDSLISWFGSKVDYAPANSDNVLASFSSLFEDSALHYHERFINSSRSFKAFPGESLTSLSIENCCNFTPQVLRAFVIAREDGALEAKRHETNENSTIEQLYLRGRFPAMSQEDKIWFEDNAEIWCVNWGIHDDAGVGEDSG